jgi:hypothetical protein
MTFQSPRETRGFSVTRPPEVMSEAKIGHVGCVGPCFRGRLPLYNAPCGNFFMFQPRFSLTKGRGGLTSNL